MQPTVSTEDELRCGNCKLHVDLAGYAAQARIAAKNCSALPWPESIETFSTDDAKCNRPISFQQKEKIDMGTDWEGIALAILAGVSIGLLAGLIVWVWFFDPVAAAY